MNKNSLNLLLAGGAAAVAAGAATVAGLTYAFAVEPMTVELERITFRLAGTNGRLPAQGLRILHLTDSHFRGAHKREQSKIESIRRLTAGLEYDLLVHTGDFIHHDAGMENALELLRAVPAPRLGRFAVLGNHDYAHYAMEEALPRMWRTFSRQERGRGWPTWSLPLRLPWFVHYVRHTPLDGRRSGSNDTQTLACRLREEGFTVLHNSARQLTDADGGLDLWLAGVDDVTEGWPRLGHTLESVPADAPVVLLSHNPDIVASPQIERVGLVISGHTHGGQIVLPLWGPAHTQSWYLERTEVSGTFRRGRAQVYVSRGIGEGIPLRFRARPQVTLITVVGGSGVESRES